MNDVHYVITAIRCDAGTEVSGYVDAHAAVEAYVSYCSEGVAETVHEDGSHTVLVKIDIFGETGNLLNGMDTKGLLECEHTRRSDAEFATQTGGGARAR